MVWRLSPVNGGWGELKHGMVGGSGCAHSWGVVKIDLNDGFYFNKLRAGIYNYMIRPRNISGTLRYKTRRFFGCLSPWKSTNLTFLSNLWAAMSKSNPPKNSYIFFLIDLAWDQTWSFIRIILTRPECNVIFPPGFPRHTVSSIFYIDNVGGSSRQFEKNIAFARNDSLYSLTYYSNDPILWCSLDSQSYHQLDPELNGHRNLIGIKLLQCHPDSRSIRLNFLFEPRPFLTSQAVKLYHRWSWLFYFVNTRRSFLYELWAS